MFFPSKIASIATTDRVLEVGPGATPFFRSDIFLEKNYDNQSELVAQSGHVGLLKTEKPVYKYDGGVFPFKDKEFDYVICSHVLEHVDNADVFLNEIQRVGKRGYLEFPTIYYDYVYNFPEHKLFLFYKEGVINWMTKEESGLNQFRSIQKLFYRTCELGYDDLIQASKDYFFQGFEWFEKIESRRVTDINLLTFKGDDILLSPKNRQPNFAKISLKEHLKFKVKNLLK